MVPARARRPLHRARRLRDAGDPARRGAALDLRLELGQPRRARRCPDRRLDRGRGGAVRDGGGARDLGRPQGGPPRPSRRPGGAARDGAGARGRPVIRRRRPVALLQLEQPVGGPAGAQGPAGRGPGRPGAPADREPQDGRPPRQDQPRGDPAGDGDGRRRRVDPRCARPAGAAVALRAGEDDERPARGALRCLRADPGRADGGDLRRARTGGHARRRPLQDGPRLRAAVPRRRPVSATVQPAGGRRGRHVRGGRRRRGRRARDRAAACARREVLRG